MWYLIPELSVIPLDSHLFTMVFSSIVIMEGHRLLPWNPSLISVLGQDQRPQRKDGSKQSWSVRGSFPVLCKTLVEPCDFQALVHSISARMLRRREPLNICRSLRVRCGRKLFPQIPFHLISDVDKGSLCPRPFHDHLQTLDARALHQLREK